MNTYRLPRKFKVAFSNNSEDTANATIADLGFLAVQMDGRNYFRVYIGGSLGVNADIAVPFGDLIRPEEVLYHVEAAISLFVEEGDFENKGKARMRYIVKRMGYEHFLQCYRNHLNLVNKTMKLNFTIDEETKEVQEKEVQEKEVQKIEIESKEIESNEIKSNEVKSMLLSFPEVIAQRQEGLYTIVLHPQGGLLLAEDYNNIVTFLEQVPKASVRLSMEESIYVQI